MKATAQMGEVAEMVKRLRARAFSDDDLYAEVAELLEEFGRRRCDFPEHVAEILEIDEDGKVHQVLSPPPPERP